MGHGEALNLLVSLLALTNPLGNLPIFLRITAAETVAGRHRIALVSGVAAFVTMALFYWFGLAVLAAFGIGLEAFVLGGGLILLLYGLAMVRAPEVLLPHPSGQPGELARRSPAIVPLAIPLLVGPGTIARVMLHRYDLPGTEAGMLATLTIFVVALLVTLTLFFAEQISGWVGPAGIAALSRILGMLIMAIGFTGITQALAKLWPGLAG
jgi:multiple antibiotic resistance protein